MWDIERHIQDEETIEYLGTPKWIGYLKVFILAFVGIFAITFLEIFILKSLMIWSTIVLLMIFPIIIFTKLSTKYIITNKRVAGRNGILSEDFKSATFKHITSVRTKQGMIGKMFNVGNITIDTAGAGDGVDFVWKHVENPVKIQNLIEKHID